MHTERHTYTAYYIKYINLRALLLSNLLNIDRLISSKVRIKTQIFCSKWRIFAVCNQKQHLVNLKSKTKFKKNQ
jgi:hypothetical protein